MRVSAVMVFQIISESVGLPLDRVRYLILFMVSYPLAVILRVLLPYTTTSTTVRHVYSVALGILFGILCFGWQVCYLLSFVGIGYLLLITLPTRRVQWYSMVYALVGVSVGHVYRLITDYGGYTLDFTGPLMLLVQRVTYVAFAYHDGTRKDENLNEDQRKNKISVVPSILEYFSYNFSFLNILAGPTCAYHEYIDMITGDNFERLQTHGIPSPVVPALKKFLYAIFFVTIYVLFDDKHMDQKILDPSLSSYYRLLYITIFCFVVRCRYYFTFIIVESINNTAGLGFDGYDDSGNPKWDLVVGVNVKGFEAGVNCKEQSNSWNICTAKWLRRVVYERVTIAPTLLTYLVSATWHGFYPAYYMSFAFLGSCTLAGRKVRNLLWHRFQKPLPLKIFYDIATTLTSNICKDFSEIAFLFLSFEKAYHVWSYYYFVPFIVVVSVAILCPDMKAKRNRQQTKTTEGTSIKEHQN